MEIKNINNIEFSDDIDGRVRKLYECENFSIRYAVVGLFKKHKHERADEVYLIRRGEGFVIIDENRTNIKAGDVISIPKGKFHYFENDGKLGPFEIMIVSCPAYNKSDVFS